ncbi:MAG: hypothetical protein AAGI11_10010 [Pseudomonadota bacterium]
MAMNARSAASWLRVTALGLLLAACSEPLPPEQTEPQQALPEAEPVSDAPAPDTEAAPPEADPLVEPAPASQPLDLSLPADVMEDHEFVDLSEEEDKLPNLFTDEERERNTRLSGRLLLDETGEEDSPSVTGAEITVERKLN